MCVQGCVCILSIDIKKKKHVQSMKHAHGAAMPMSPGLQLSNYLFEPILEQLLHQAMAKSRSSWITLTV